MSNYTGSSVSSKACVVNGIPKLCWCGDNVVIILSKSDANPYRRFYRCATAASKKLCDDGHVFKWLDEGIVNEIDTLKNAMARLENDVKTMSQYMEEQERLATARVEGEFLEKVEEMIMETRRQKWKMIFSVLICVGSVLVMKMLG